MQRVMLLLLLLIVLAPGCLAAEGRKYAAMSLLGDRMELVVARMQTGTNIPANSREIVKFPDPAFDRFILRTVDRIVTDRNGGEGVTMLAAIDPRFYALQERMLDKGSGVEDLLAAIRGAISKQPASHLILITRYRHEAMLRIENRLIGAGMLSGIGFYVDHVRPLRNTASLERSVGFLAPYAYFQILIVDLGTLQVIRSETAMTSYVHGSAVKQGAIHPWDSMQDGTKIQVLQALLRDELRRVLPPLLAE